MYRIVSLHAFSPEIDKGEKRLAAVCDRDGSIRWFEYRKLEVIEVDGQTPKELLGEFLFYTSVNR